MAFPPRSTLTILLKCTQCHSLSSLYCSSSHLQYLPPFTAVIDGTPERQGPPSGLYVLVHTKCLGASHAREERAIDACGQFENAVLSLTECQASSSSFLIPNWKLWWNSVYWKAEIDPYIQRANWWRPEGKEVGGRGRMGKWLKESGRCRLSIMRWVSHWEQKVQHREHRQWYCKVL